MRPLKDYIYMNDQKVFYYLEEEENFQLLYDFGAELGDTLTLKFWPNINPVDTVFHLYIDSMDFVNFDNLQLKRFHVKFDLFDQEEISFPTNQTSPIIEGIGSTFNFFYLNELVNSCKAFDTDVYELRCFSNFTNGAYEIITPCEVIVGKPEIDKTIYTIRPNPTNSTIVIDLPENIQTQNIIVYNTTGKSILKKKIFSQSQKEVAVDLSKFDSGLYLVKVEYLSDKRIKVMTKPIVKL